MLIIAMTSMVLAGSAMLLSCSEQGSAFEPVPTVPTVPTTPSTEPEPLRLAFASALSSHAGTRLTSAIVQNSASYRDIEDFRFFSVKKEGGTITSVNNADVYNGEKRDHLPVRYYHYGYCDMRRGVNGCLVYAKAKDVKKETTLETLAYNGSLNPYFEEKVTSTDQIYFEPVSIYGDMETIPDGAKTLAKVLTDIANISVNGAHWATFNNPDLQSLFAHFTNYGYDLPGSAASVREWIQALKEAAETLHFGDGTTDKAIRDNIIAKAGDYLNELSPRSILASKYPQDINLPDGAAALRWTDVVEDEVTVKKFVPQLQTTTLDDINSVSRFVYPPALYYRVESDIWTSNDRLTFDQYKEKTKWKGDSEDDPDAVQTLFHDGGTIQSTTKSIAIQDPLQYAVAQLQLRVEVDADVSGSELKYDNKGNTITYTDGTNHYIRLTGVIVGGQRRVGYDFKPVSNSDLYLRFVYDNQVPANFWLKQGSNDVVNTLVLQSYDHEDLNVILEYEYTGATAFKCLNGYVYPNTRFYLVGEVKADQFDNNTHVNDTNKDRIFTQDYTTYIQMTVVSLEKAYNVLPSIISQNLEIGVMTTPMWKAAEPSDAVIMD